MFRRKKAEIDPAGDPQITNRPSLENVQVALKKGNTTTNFDLDSDQGYEKASSKGFAIKDI